MHREELKSYLDLQMQTGEWARCWFVCDTSKGLLRFIKVTVV
eukprot:UN21630